MDTLLTIHKGEDAEQICSDTNQPELMKRIYHNFKKIIDNKDTNKNVYFEILNIVRDEKYTTKDNAVLINLNCIPFNVLKNMDAVITKILERQNTNF
jgi:hypothetical protein